MNPLLPFTYRRDIAHAREATRSLLLTAAPLESIVAIVVVMGLAVLDYFSVSRRQSQFGVLHALDHSRLRLVWRIVQETSFTTGIAWAISVVVYLIGLLYLRFGVFAPLGLRFDLFNLTPWLFSLPIPIATFAITTGTTAQTLAKLDSAPLIGRRS